MSYYRIDDVISLLYGFEYGGCRSRRIAKEISDTLNNLSVGISIPYIYRTDLFRLMNNLRYRYDGYFREVAERVIEKIRRERLSDACAFYSRYGVSTKEIAINPDYEVHADRIDAGEELFQWCRLFMIDGGTRADIYDEHNGKCSIGRYFSRERVSLESLGAMPFFDLTDSYGNFYGTASQVRFRFRFPFSVPCLLSTASPAVDSWNSRHYFDGTIINRDQFSGLWAPGGAKQYFIPLSETQKIELAKTAVKD